MYMEIELKGNMAEKCLKCAYIFHFRAFFGSFMLVASSVGQFLCFLKVAHLVATSKNLTK